MPQLNVHIPESSTLLRRVEKYAEMLGLSTSTLARAVLETSLESYVDARLAALTHVNRLSDTAAEPVSSRLNDQTPAVELSSEAEAPAPTAVSRLGIELPYTATGVRRATTA